MSSFLNMKNDSRILSLICHMTITAGHQFPEGVRWHCMQCCKVPVRGIRGIFFRGGKAIFLEFFPGVKCYFLVENFHFGRRKTNFSGFKKWKTSAEISQWEVSGGHSVPLPLIAVTPLVPVVGLSQNCHYYNHWLTENIHSYIYPGGATWIIGVLMREQKNVRKGFLFFFLQ